MHEVEKMVDLVIEELALITPLTDMLIIPYRGKHTIPKYNMQGE